MLEKRMYGSVEMVISEEDVHNAEKDNENDEHGKPSSRTILYLRMW
jgi:hypothetical protein